MTKVDASEHRNWSEVRTLGPGDLADAFELSRLAGWNQTEADWRRLLALSPDGCWGIEKAGRIVATAILVRYGCHCAWIGMVLTHPSWRGRGFARRLVGHALAIARKLGIVAVKLDATSQGQSLYESFGFTREQSVERWERPGTSAFSGSVQNYSLAMDKAAYGYSRADLLESLGGATSGHDGVDGYALTRPGAIRSYLGPCIARNPGTAKHLLTPILDAVPGSGWFWDLFTENRNAAGLASAFGFQPVRRLVRMRIGAPIREKEQDVYALAGFEFG